MKFNTTNDWIKFSLYIQGRNRFYLDNESKKFIKTILITARKRRKILRSGEVFYRARAGCNEKSDKKVVFNSHRPYPAKDMLKPPSENAVEGRLNPKGIGYLYLASTLDAAIVEARPWVGKFVSVIKCRIFGDIKVIDLTTVTEINFHTWFKKRHSDKEKEEMIWYSIVRDFSEPISDHSSSVDHIPTQYLAEIIKNSGYDGITYKSSLSSKGYNLVLFNSWRASSAEKSKLYKVLEVRYSTEPS